jgi:hypothetical protein
MASAMQTQKLEVPQGEKVEKKEGLAPVARMILEKGFRDPDFEKFYDSVREKCNLVFAGKGTPADVEFLEKEIGKHEAEIERLYQPEVAEIMKNYFRKLKANLREAAESTKV